MRVVVVLDRCMVIGRAVWVSVAFRPEDVAGSRKNERSAFENTWITDREE